MLGTNLLICDSRNQRSIEEREDVIIAGNSASATWSYFGFGTASDVAVDRNAMTKSVNNLRKVLTIFVKHLQN